VGGVGQLHVDRDACKGSTDTPDREGRLRERRRPRNSVMGSRKTRLIVRSDAEISAKARTSEASAEESMSVYRILRKSEKQRKSGAATLSHPVRFSQLRKEAFKRGAS